VLNAARLQFFRKYPGFDGRDDKNEWRKAENRSGAGRYEESQQTDDNEDNGPPYHPSGAIAVNLIPVLVRLKRLSKTHAVPAVHPYLVLP